MQVFIVTTYDRWLLESLSSRGTANAVLLSVSSAHASLDAAKAAANTLDAELHEEAQRDAEAGEIDTIDSWEPLQWEAEGTATWVSWSSIDGRAWAICQREVE